MWPHEAADEAGGHHNQCTRRVQWRSCMRCNGFVRQRVGMPRTLSCFARGKSSRMSDVERCLSPDQARVCRSRSSISPDIVSVNAMCAMFSQTGTKREVLQFLENVSSSGLQPTTTTFSLLMSALVQRQQGAAALAVWQRMQQSGTAADDACETAHLKALSLLVRPL
jgi:pentatricopeptide repeat protein